MSRSVLLQLARDSIEEVLQARRTIDKQSLLQQHPLLNERIATQVNVYLEDELRGQASSTTPELTLIEDIIRNAKRCAFEDMNFSPLTTNEYLHCEIEVLLSTPDGIMQEKDAPILLNENPSIETILRET